MSYILDWILIILSTVITYRSYKQIVFKRHSSVAYYVILVDYIFCCLPILLNYIMGYPQYVALYWYRVFQNPMQNHTVSAAYDIYILTSIVTLYYYGKRSRKKLSLQFERETKVVDRAIDNKYFYFFVIFSPLIYAVVTGNILKMFTYTSLTIRGIMGQDYLAINSLILLSIYCLSIYVFSGSVTKGKVFLLIIVSVVLAWMQGKRFIVAVMTIFYLFFLSKSNISEKTRKRLLLVLPIGGVVLIVFSAIYFIVIKPLSNMGFDTIYDMLRVDFGRDDVIKFVIWKEFLKSEHILNYPGQSFFSTFFIFIPRFIWHSKPYSHYQYLTSSILGVPIQNLSAGTTPSWYEMCLCNFGYFGYFIGIIGLPLLCKLADSMKQVKSKSLVFMFILTLLTQNTDVYIVYIYLIFFYLFVEHTKYKRIVFGSRNRHRRKVIDGRILDEKNE